jgi:predicted kinase
VAAKDLIERETKSATAIKTTTLEEKAEMESAARVPTRMYSPPQTCVLIRGYPGVGKTTLARALALETGYFLLLKDDIRGPALAHDMRMRSEIKRRCGESANAAVALVDSNAACYHIMNAVAATQLSVGARGVILESPLGRKDVADNATGVAVAAGALCVLVDCVLEPEIWRQRLAARREVSRTGRQRDMHTHHSFAHNVLPKEPEDIRKHYPGGLQFHIDRCDATVEVDCALSVGAGVETILETLRLLHAKEDVEHVHVET